MACAKELLFEPGGLRGIGSFDGIGLDFEIDAGDIRAAIERTEACALTEFCEADVATAAEFQARGNQDRVNVHTCLPLKLKQQIDCT